jgi:hypothetical protein
MRYRRDEILLREYVRNSLLVEDEAGGNPAMFGGGFSSYDSGMGMGGAHYGSGNDMYDAFIGPFVDVFKTAVGKTKEITRKARTVLWVGLQTVLTTLIPIYGYNYADVFDKEKEDIEKIKGEYKDVYARTDAALASPDAGLLAFMASPALVLGAVATKKSAAVSKELLSAVTGGFSDELYDSVTSKLEAAGRMALGDDGRGGSKPSKKKDGPRSMWGESQLREDDEPDDKKKFTPAKILSSKKFLAKALDAPQVKKMQADATKVYRKTLTDVFSQAENVLKKVKTIEDIEKAAGSKLKGDAKAKVEEIKKLPPQEKTKAEKMLVDGSRKASKEFYIKSLEDHVDKVLKAGIPEEAQYIKDYRAVIQKIKAL